MNLENSGVSYFEKLKGISGGALFLKVFVRTLRYPSVLFWGIPNVYLLSDEFEKFLETSVFFP